MLPTFAYMSPQDMWIIGIVVLVLFGANKIPQFAKGLGEGIREFKKSVTDEHENDAEAEREKQRRELEAAREKAEKLPVETGK